MQGERMELSKWFGLEVGWKTHKGQRRFDLRICKIKKSGQWEYTGTGIIIAPELAEEFVDLVNRAAANDGGEPNTEESAE